VTTFMTRGSEKLSGPMIPVTDTMQGNTARVRVAFGDPVWLHARFGAVRDWHTIATRTRDPWLLAGSYDVDDSSAWATAREAVTRGPLGQIAPALGWSRAENSWSQLVGVCRCVVCQIEKKNSRLQNKAQA
jgi:hypothetical protein